MSPRWQIIPFNPLDVGRFATRLSRHTSRAYVIMSRIYACHDSSDANLGPDWIITNNNQNHDDCYRHLRTLAKVSWLMKSFMFRFTFHWNLFLRVEWWIEQNNSTTPHGVTSWHWVRICTIVITHLLVPTLRRSLLGHWSSSLYYTKQERLRLCNWFSLQHLGP